MAHPFRPHRETAPTLAAWGDTASIVASLVVVRPSLAARLMLASSRIVHSLAAYMQLAHSEGHAVGDIADALEHQHVRDLLGRAIPNPHPRLLGMLSRMGKTALDLSDYLRLNEVLHGPAGHLIQSAVEITPSRLAVADQIVTDPVLLAAHKAISWSASNVDILQDALTYLRITGLARDIEALPPGSGWRAILRRINADLGRARAPLPPFVAPAGWRHIETVAGLWLAGTALGNCVANMRSGSESYIANLISGEAIYLVHDAEPTMLACIRRVGPNLWIVAEKSMSRSNPAETATGAALISGLTACIAATGGKLLDLSPLSAIQHIAWRAERAEATVEDDDLDGVEAAA
jgi:hypothetical protein